MPTTRYGLDTGLVGVLAEKLDEILGGAWAPNRAGMDPGARGFAYHGGYALVAGVATQMPNGTIVCTDDATVFVQRDRAGVVSMSVTYDPLLLPMAEVTCAAGVLTYFQDIRDLAFVTPQLANIPAIVGPVGTAETLLNTILADLKAQGFMVPD